MCCIQHVTCESVFPFFFLLNKPLTLFFVDLFTIIDYQVFKRRICGCLTMFNSCKLHNQSHIFTSVIFTLGDSECFILIKLQKRVHYDWLIHFIFLPMGSIPARTVFLHMNIKQISMPIPTVSNICSWKTIRVS